MSIGSKKGKITSYRSQKRAKLVGNIIATLFLAGGSILILLPFWWMVSTALKSMDEIMVYPPTFFPKDWLFSNFVKAWNTAPFTRYTLNTLFIAFFDILGNVFVNAFVAYGFAKIKFPGKKIFFSIILATMMIPGFVTLIPQYILFSKLGWVDSYLPLLVPVFFGNPFHIFMMRQFFMTIPNELIEAAKMDGANHTYIWSRLMLPLIKPVLATVAIISFKGAWNNFLGPLLYVNDEMKYTIQIGLQTFRGTVQTQWNYLMAASVLVILPVVILFFVFQRYFIEGMNITGSSKG